MGRQRVKHLTTYYYRSVDFKYIGHNTQMHSDDSR